MSIQIIPTAVGFPLQTATTLTIVSGNYEISTGTTQAYVTGYVYAGLSGETFIGSSSVVLPNNVFTAFTHDIGGSGVTIVENYVLSQYNFTRL